MPKLNMCKVYKTFLVSEMQDISFTFRTSKRCWRWISGTRKWRRKHLKTKISIVKSEQSLQIFGFWNARYHFNFRTSKWCWKGIDGRGKWNGKLLQLRIGSIGKAKILWWIKYLNNNFNYIMEKLSTILNGEFTSVSWTTGDKVVGSSTI